ncbi:MAG: cytochrome b6-f complex subunit PetG [Gemmatimonadaceae bacterium]|nr:cytochrome b6-f complex subunit PetG [Gloeobacterales cyanobacterium ES-bin-141]
MIEPILLGLVVGFVPVTIAGLLVAAWLQYKQGNPSGLNEK